MYLTAHEVRSKAGKNGINAFLHLHQEQAIPMRRAGEPDLDLVSQLAGGYLIAQSITLTPGGNEVVAHLDLAARDDVSEDALARAVSGIETRIGSERTPIIVAGFGTAARFGALIGLDDSAAEQRRILNELWAAGRALLTHRNDGPRRASGRLVVWAAYDSTGVRLWLPPATLSRLPRSVARRSCILVPSALIAEASIDGLRESAMTLLGLNDAEIDQEGGIEVVDPRTTKTLAKYGPKASSLPA